MSLTIDPPAASVPAAGGKSAHTLANAGEAKVLFKVKCSNNNDYRVNPVFGFVDPAGQTPLEITRTVSQISSELITCSSPGYLHKPSGSKAFLEAQSAENPLI
ncbi:hypothetical protein Y032_0650g1132 [Ancylostoma ceylanicum]|uniref:MSP domain-containing protein n=1 Tax=Ancylostoma ceylanicum TaxID=53326 RepID=A0A016WKQ3_9BILA|nr:hypothetical protein Y032_0650g1132 [Ancylostoma ceylanicum]